jgi:hypothetical protein
MAKQPFTPPEYKKSAFNCPHCMAYANHTWGEAKSTLKNGQSYWVGDVNFSHCMHCNKESIWVSDVMVFPALSPAPLPNPDIPEDIRFDYNEARTIFGNSPRGAAALLRLCIQKLCKHLGEPGKNINKDIAALVQKGLSPKIQQSLDIVGVFGNEAVLPGLIDLNDNPETAVYLFNLVNIITETMITQPKMIESLYGSLPAEKIEQIDQRDKDSKK